MSYGYKAMLGLGAPPSGGGQFDPDAMLAEVLSTANNGKPLDLTIPSNFAAAKTAVSKLVDTLPFDLSSAVPSGAGGSAIAGAAPTVISLVNSAASGNWKGVANTLIGVAGGASCGPPCAAVASFAGNILTQASPVIVDAIRVSFGGQSALTSELKERAWQLQGESQAAASAFARNKDLALKSLEASEKAMYDAAVAAASDIFAKINNLPGYTDAQTALASLLANSPGKTADSLVDPRNPKGPTFAQQASVTASAANRAAIARSGLSGEFKRVLAKTIGQLDALRYRWRAVDGTNFGGSTYWWKNMPPDRFANPFGKRAKFGTLSLPTEFVEYDYPAVDDAGAPYEAMCTLASFRTPSAQFRGRAGWKGTDTRAWIPLRVGLDIDDLKADARLKPDSADDASWLIDLYNSTWRPRMQGKMSGSKNEVEQQLENLSIEQESNYGSALQAQWRRLSCVLQARLRTFRAFTQLALGKFSKEALRETLNRSLQKASKQRAAEVKNHTGLAVGFAMLAVAGAIAVVAAKKRKKLSSNRRRRHARR